VVFLLSQLILFVMFLPYERERPSSWPAPAQLFAEHLLSLHHECQNVACR
jgi:hypothetical protein